MRSDLRNQKPSDQIALLQALRPNDPKASQPRRSVASATRERQRVLGPSTCESFSKSCLHRDMNRAGTRFSYACAEY